MVTDEDIQKQWQKLQRLRLAQLNDGGYLFALVSPSNTSDKVSNVDRFLSRKMTKEEVYEHLTKINSQASKCPNAPQGEVQQPTVTPPPTGKGLFGSEVLPTPYISPDDGGAVQQPPTQPPTTQTPPTIAPEDSQSDDQSGTGGGGGVKPPLGDDLLPDTGIREQPEIQQPEEPSNEGQDTAGPLT